MRISKNIVFWAFTAVMAGAAAYFTANVIAFKSDLNRSAKNLTIASGQKVTVVKVIDGDEFSVRFDDKQFVVRMLGIASYDPTVDDPALKGAAQAAYNFLEQTVLNREITLVFENFKQDEKRRCLSYIDLRGKDVGLRMVSEGLTLVYTKYPFSRMPEYLRRETAAMGARRGLWADPSAANRSLALKKSWDPSGK